MDFLFMFVIGIVFVAIIVGTQWYFIERHKEQTSQTPAPIINTDLTQVNKLIEGLPNKVLQSIISSNNNLKGNLGELIGYLKLQAEYDRIIPLGNIVDFICIKFPSNENEGSLDFIDIKTDKAKLSKDQTALKRLITEKKINFIKIQIKMDQTVEVGDVIINKADVD